MARRKSKRFEFGKGIYYFVVKKGYRSEIIIKRLSLKKALQAFKYYAKSSAGQTEWLGKWQGEKFVDTNLAKLQKNDLQPSLAV